jgi:hypothetical protein
MMAPPGSNGDVGPGSTTKPIFFAVLFQVTVVPADTQKSALLLAAGALEVEEAPLEVRFTSTTHGVEADPHVLPALQACAGFGSEQAYLLLFDCAVALLPSTISVIASKIHLIPKFRSIVKIHLARWIQITRSLDKARKLNANWRMQQAFAKGGANWFQTLSNR